MLLKHKKTICLYAPKKECGGLSVIELLLVVVILGIISLVVVPQIGGSLDATYDKTAQSLASSLKASKQTYRLRVGSAATTYAAASDDDARYVLVQPYIDGGASPATLSGFVGTGYSATMGATVNSATSVTSPTGNIFSSN